MAARKHKKYKYKEQRVADTFPGTFNHYNLLHNDSENYNTPVSTERLRVVNSSHVRNDKMNHKKRVVEKKEHKVVVFK